MIFRKLKADEIECRIGSINSRGFTMLLYKDARCDMNILDETVGALNWQREHLRDNANCIVSIWDESKETWVSKEDTGTESYTEKEKGIASDSFKRACFNWGIGRELYTAPLIFIRAKTEPQGKGYALSDKRDGYGYKVAQIEYEGGRITKLIITKDGEQKFYYEADKFLEQSQNTIDEKMEQMVLIMAENARNAEVLKSMRIRTPSDVKKMTIAQYGDFARRCNQ